MNLKRIWILLNPDSMVVEVMLNSFSTLDFPKYPHKISLLNFNVHFYFSKWSFYDVTSQSAAIQRSFLLLIGWRRNIKVYSEIQQWYFEKLILKICGHFGKSKMLSWFNTGLPQIQDFEIPDFFKTFSGPEIIFF